MPITYRVIVRYSSPTCRTSHRLPPPCMVVQGCLLRSRNTAGWPGALLCCYQLCNCQQISASLGPAFTSSCFMPDTFHFLSLSLQFMYCS